MKKFCECCKKYRLRNDFPSTQEMGYVIDNISDGQYDICYECLEKKFKYFPSKITKK